MKIDLCFSGSHLDELQLRDKNVVVVDVLRSSTSIAMALMNGAREVIPVATVENAVKISGSLFGDVTLRGGERSGKMIEGFNLGNSPIEYTEAAVKGKSIIFCTTNGSVAISKSRYAKNLVVGGFVNLTKVVEFIKEINNDFLISCAGRIPSLSDFSLEDAVCGGMIIASLSKSTDKIELSDSAQAAYILFKRYSRNLQKMLKLSAHGKYLIEIGFAKDLEICSAVDSIPVLPIFSNNALRLRKEEARPAELPETKQVEQ
jgi:2-phosphosulfolactate phosphatase